MLHFTFPFNDPENYPYPYIGDVHPFYDQASETWYMFYLDIWSISLQITDK